VSRLVETQIYRVHNVLECRYSLSIHSNDSTATERAAAILSDSSWNRNLLIRIDQRTNCNSSIWVSIRVYVYVNLSLTADDAILTPLIISIFWYRIQNIEHKTNSNETNNIKLTFH